MGSDLTPGVPRINGRARGEQIDSMVHHSSCVARFRGPGSDLRVAWTAMTARATARFATGKVNALPACPQRLGARSGAAGEHLAQIGLSGCNQLSGDKNKLSGVKNMQGNLHGALGASLGPRQQQLGSRRSFSQ